jgi:excisionase family DNA binding protein
LRQVIEKLWTIEEVADFLQVKISVVRYWLHTSGMPFIKIGKHYRFDPHDIREWVESCKCRRNELQDQLRQVT